MGARPGRWGKGRGERGLVDGVCGAPRSYGRGHARPHHSSWVPPTQRERSGSLEGVASNDRGGVSVQARGEADRGGLRGRLDTCVHSDVQELAT